MLHNFRWGAGVTHTLAEPLGDAFTLHESDKQSSHSYGPIYQWVLDSLHLTHGRLRILEVGVSSMPPGSFLSWQHHVGVERVVGVDWSLYRGPVLTPNQFVQGDAYSLEMVSALKMCCPERFHLVIDDGSHHACDQQFFLKEYASLCVPDGYLVVEDVRDWGVLKTCASMENAIIVDLTWNRCDVSRSQDFEDDDSRLILCKAVS